MLPRLLSSLVIFAILVEVCATVYAKDSQQVEIAGLSGSEKSLAAQWKAGVARAVITPEKSVWLAGYGAKRKPDGKLHDLWVKALASRTGVTSWTDWLTASGRIRPSRLNMPSRARPARQRYTKAVHPGEPGWSRG